MDEPLPIQQGADSAPAYDHYPEPGLRALITAGLILTTLMTSIDSTIANTVLPQIRASVSASQDEILWVLTSFILASTVVTPAIGWLERRFGRRNLLLFALVGFTAASMLCGIAQSIIEMVFFRVLQGATAAVFVPLSQAILRPDPWRLPDRASQLALGLLHQHSPRACRLPPAGSDAAQAHTSRRGEV